MILKNSRREQQLGVTEESSERYQRVTDALYQDELRVENLRV